MNNTNSPWMAENAHLETDANPDTVDDLSMELSMQHAALMDKFERNMPGDGARIHLIYEMNALELKMALLTEISCWTKYPLHGEASS